MPLPGSSCVCWREPQDRAIQGRQARIPAISGLVDFARAQRAASDERGQLHVLQRNELIHQVKGQEHEPHGVATQPDQGPLGQPAQALPGQPDLPAVSRCSPPSRCSSVDFQQPLGPSPPPFPLRRLLGRPRRRRGPARHRHHLVRGTRLPSRPDVREVCTVICGLGALEEQLVPWMARRTVRFALTAEFLLGHGCR